MRVSGVTLPDEKRVDIALAYLYGIGRNNAKDVIRIAKVDGAIRVKNLSEDDQKAIAKVLESYKLEGDLRADVTASIKRLKEIGSYRGMRHSKSLPSRGQRTRSNARTKRGKRVTIGAIKKEVAAKIEAAKTTK